ncbi:flagellar hook-length control protein FliK [Salipaludibacillus aurantiacus]|uniref:Hook-length control protein FliK n=1 Tax=Salipaludibacillus aurantiacus TaxID=1601833 RepID=A0A1H9QJG9_9BACI|nr:flagellar hook-length control protein FliK [Salipaludibacillus aurantiacus]SER60557.1 hook-length control protein FliK [Salipaludibacillus aurantiacus]
MDEMPLLKPIVPLASVFHNGSNHPETREEEGLEEEFLQLLTSISEEENLDIEYLKDTKKNDGPPSLIAYRELEELAATLVNDIKEILKVIEQLPLEDSFISEEMLENKEIKQLLSSLPVQWAEDFQLLFERRISLEGLTEDLKDEGTPANLLALISAFTYKEQLETEWNRDKVLHVITQLTEAYFPDLKQREKNTAFSQLADQLGKFLSRTKIEESGLIAIPYQGKKQAANPARALELPYLIHTPAADQKEPANSIKTMQMPVLMPDTANSQLARFQHTAMLSGENEAGRASQEQVIRQFHNLLGRSAFQQLSNGVQQLSLKLHPASLGRMDVTIQQVNGVMTATLMTTTKTARDLIEGQMTQLRHAFQAQNIQVDKIEITQQHTQQSLKDAEREGTGKDRYEENQRNDGSSEDDEEQENEEFSDFLEATFNTEV